MRKHVFAIVCGFIVCAGLAVCLIFWSRHGARPTGVTEAGNKPVLNMAIGEIPADSASTTLVEGKESEKLACNQHEIDIPEPMREALKKWNPDFVLWRSTEYSPYLCLNITTSPTLALNAGLGDFNDDGLQDVVVVGHNNQSELLVVVLSQKNAGYKVMQLSSSGINGTSEQGAQNCFILGTGFADGLKQFPRAAICMILPKKTEIDVNMGDLNYISTLKSEAFIAGLSQDFSGPKHNYNNPFMAAQLFWWNLRNETDKEWEWLNTGKDFIAWDLNTINGNNNSGFCGLGLGC